MTNAEMTIITIYEKTMAIFFFEDIELLAVRNNVITKYLSLIHI